MNLLTVKMKVLYQSENESFVGDSESDEIDEDDRVDYKLLQHTKKQLFLDDDSQHSGSISVASNKTILELIDKDVQQKQLEMDMEKFSVGKFCNKMKTQEILEEESEAHSDTEELKL